MGSPLSDDSRDRKDDEAVALTSEKSMKTDGRAGLRLRLFALSILLLAMSLSIFALYERQKQGQQKCWNLIGTIEPLEDEEDSVEVNGWSTKLSSDGKTVLYGAPFVSLSSSFLRVSQYQGNNVWNRIGHDINADVVYDTTTGVAAISAGGSVVAVGVTDYAAGVGNEHVQVFGIDESGQWKQLGADIPGSFAAVSLSFDGKILAVGSGLNMQNIQPVRVYEFNGQGMWVQRGQDIVAECIEEFRFGFDLSLSSDGSKLAVGSPYFGSTGYIESSGFVTVYEFDTNKQWVRKGQKIEGGPDSDRFGWSVSISSEGSIIAIGHPGYDHQRGRLIVYHMDGDDRFWRQLGDSMSSDEPNNYSAWSVSISSDGKTVAEADTGGHIRVYEMMSDGKEWSQRGYDIPSGIGFDFPSVSLSADGTVVSFGSEYRLPRIFEYSKCT